MLSALVPTSYSALSGGLMVLELVLIAIRGWTEQQHLSHHIKIMDNAINTQTLQPEHLDELLRAKAHAEVMQLHVYKKLALNLGVTILTTSLFFIKSIVLPMVLVSAAVNPFIPFLFATIALSISVVNHYLIKYIDQEKPKFRKENLTRTHSLPYNRNTFFQANEADSIQNQQDIRLECAHLLITI